MNAQQQLPVDAEPAETCIVCRCTELDACLEAGVPCSWKQHDPPVCTSCCGLPITSFFPTAGGTDWQPCPLRNGHPPPHIYWRQTVDASEKKRKNGVKIIDESGNVIAMLDTRGATTPLEVRAALGYIR